MPGIGDTPSNISSPAPSGFVYPRILTALLLAIYWALIGFYASLFVAGIWAIDLKWRIDHHQGWSFREADASRSVLLGLAHAGPIFVALGVIAFVLLLIWLYRVRKNVSAIETFEMRWSLGWTVWGWFVPVLSLWVPLEAMTDIWRASNAARGSLLTRTPRAPRLFPIWWTVAIIAGLIAWLFLYARLISSHSPRIAPSVMLGFDLIVLSSVFLKSRVVKAIAVSQRNWPSRFAGIGPVRRPASSANAI